MRNELSQGSPSLYLSVDLFTYVTPTADMSVTVTLLTLVTEIPPPTYPRHGEKGTPLVGGVEVVPRLYK